jgi:hypothetical protein
MVHRLLVPRCCSGFLDAPLNPAPTLNHRTRHPAPWHPEQHRGTMNQKP